MIKTVIKTAGAPEPIGPYNQAILWGNLLFISGQVALVPGSNDLAGKDIIEETHQVMKNLKAIYGLLLLSMATPCKKIIPM